MKFALSLILTGLPCMAAGQAPAVQLTDGPFASRAPAWSPDGARIAFESDRSGHWDIHSEGGNYQFFLESVSVLDNTNKGETR